MADWEVCFFAPARTYPNPEVHTMPLPSGVELRVLNPSFLFQCKLMLRAALLLSIVIVACSDAHGQHRFPIVPSYSTSAAFAIVAIDDFNRDGNPDALVLSTDSTTGVSSVYLMLGDGHGGFGKPITVIPKGSLIGHNYR
jgi:hypothetical protein